MSASTDEKLAPYEGHLHFDHLNEDIFENWRRRPAQTFFTVCSLIEVEEEKNDGGIILCKIMMIITSFLYSSYLFLK